MNFIVSQIGAREHYAVPRAFQLRNHLHTFYTDAWCHQASVLIRGPHAVRSFAGRFHEGVPAGKVVSFTPQALWNELIQLRHAQQNVEEIYSNFIRIGACFAGQVAKHLQRRKLNPGTEAFFGFNTGALESLEMLRGRGFLTLVDQIDPARSEEDLVFQEAERWPGWQKLPGRIPEAYYHRLAAEWSAASLVLVNSRWSQLALIDQGVPAEKIVVVPLAYEVTKKQVSNKTFASMPLTVLWLGSVTLRKGIQYLIEAAKMLENSPVRFIVAGPVHISDDAVATAPPNVSFLGRVTRDRVEELYQKADVFVLPTISDGFGITQIEAMSYGLPVITTPNCGTVVDDGQDGLIVPAANSSALASAIEHLNSNRRSLKAMAPQAVIKAGQFSLHAYAERVESAVKSHLEN